MKYIIILLSLLSFCTYSFELDDSSINDDDRDMIAHTDIYNYSLDGEEDLIKVHHDHKKGKIENDNNEALKLEGVNRIDLDMIDHATHILKRK